MKPIWLSSNYLHEEKLTRWLAILKINIDYLETILTLFFSGKEHNFNKYNLDRIDYLNEVYDTESIMHYGRNSFSIGGKPTIRAIGDPDKPLGQRNGFSKTDIAQINALYDCSGKTSKRRVRYLQSEL